MTSLGTKLALATVGVLSVISVLLYLQLTSREQQHLLSSKTTAAGMVTSLFAASLAAPLDFGDVEAMEQELGTCAATPTSSRPGSGRPAPPIPSRGCIAIDHRPKSPLPVIWMSERDCSPIGWRSRDR
jgi:hypothetical protein